jgi:hypothetical protein
MLKPSVLAISALLVAGSVYGQPTLCDKSVLCIGLISVHEFEEAQDGPREDVLNSGNFFIEPAGVTVANAAGKTGFGGTTNAVSFSGVSTNYLKFRFTGGFGNGRYSISTWVYPTSAGSTGQVQALYANDSPHQRAGMIYLENVAGSLVPKFQVYQIDDTQQIVAWGSGISTNAWHLVVVEVEPNTFSSSDGHIYISVDGGGRVSTSLSNFVRAAQYECDLGRRPYSGDEKPYTGRIDQLAQWARVLSPAEITLLYNNGSGQTFPFVTN